MLKHLLLTSAMLLPIGITPVQADDEPDTYECVGKYCFDGESLVETTPAEREQMAHLKARMDRLLADVRERMEAKQARETAQEAVWRSQCVVPWLGFWCPPREGAES